jgi:hypothetical protein
MMSHNGQSPSTVNRIQQNGHVRDCLTPEQEKIQRQKL